jgi:hypothetical protein
VPQCIRSPECSRISNCSRAEPGERRARLRVVGAYLIVMLFEELVQEGQNTPNNVVPALGRASLEGDMLGCKLAFVIHSREQKPSSAAPFPIKPGGSL